MATSKEQAKVIDITKSGPMTFRELRRANQESYEGLSPEYQAYKRGIEATTSPISLFDPRVHGEQLVSSPLSDTSTPWGESIFDNRTATEDEFQNLGDVRAENQPWYSKILNGIIKGSGLAGTTFLNGTVGLVLGGLTAITEKRISGIWDNDFMRAMQDFNDYLEQEVPNYYTQEELNRPWYENIFTANFIGDKFIKNLGFSVGAIYSGSAISAGLKLTKLPQLIGLITKSTNAPRMVTTAVGATFSAINEGSIEAFNGTKEDFYDDHKAQLDINLRNKLVAIQAKYEANKGKSLKRSGAEGNQFVDPAYEEYQQEMAEAESEYKAALAKLNEDRRKMGNAILLMNMGILVPSNLMWLSKLYSGGFTNARRIAGTTKLGAVGAITKGALVEGTEELSQNAAVRIAGNYYTTDINNFYKARTDPKAAKETLSWAKSFAEGINETVNDGSAWEEFFIGALTGVVGIPQFRSARDSQGNFQSPITLREGALGKWRDYKERMARESEIIDYVNSRLNSPQFKNYYQGLIRHNKYQNDMSAAAEQDDKFDFKNAEHAQLISDIMMFDNAGKIDELFALINEAYDTSDENLESIIKNTTVTHDDGTTDGAFVDKKGNRKTATPEGKQEMIDQLTKVKKKLVDTINNYLKIKNDLDIRTEQKLSDDQLGELTWMKSQLNNWSERALDMSKEVKSVIGNVLGSLDSTLRAFEAIRSEEGKNSADLTDTYKAADNAIQIIQKAIDNFNIIRNQDDRMIPYILANNPKIVDSLIESINNLEEDILSDSEKQDAITKIKDIVKLGNASKIYSAKLKEYLNNPQKQAEDHRRADEHAEQAEEESKVNDLKTRLKSATNMKEFRDIISEVNEIETTNKALDELENEGHDRAKNYREISRYNAEVRRVINSSDADPQVKEDVFKLLQDHFDNSENLELLANPNSIYINNENAFDEDSNGDVELSATRFQNAQYELQKAMVQVNNDEKFKDRFSPEYKRPVEKREGTVRGDDRRDTTGDSGTPTTPTVNTDTNDTTSLPTVPTTVIPIGDTTSGEIIEENKEINEISENLDNPSKGTLNKFYRPAIPELHIEASKEGDFRPFNEVAKTELGQYYWIRTKLSEEENEIVDNYIKEHPNEPKTKDLIKNALKDKLTNNSYLEKLLTSPIPNFDEIYNYFLENGTFEYLNQGKLHVGDDIKFMIDPEFEEKVKDKEWHKAPTIFLIKRDKKGYQVVGSLDESNSALRYEGLPALRNRIIQEYENNGFLIDDKFISTFTTKVSKIMVGKIPYGNRERNLGDISNVSREDKTPIFGIIKNGTLTTNGKIDNNLIISPLDMSKESKEGRLYLLIPNGAGKYSPAAVRVKHFNNKEFSLDDVTVSSTPIGEDIKETITKLASVASQDDVSEAMKTLAQNLHIQDVMVTWFEDTTGNGIVISKKVRDQHGTYEKVIINDKEYIKEDKHSIYFSVNKTAGDPNATTALIEQRDSNDIYKEILNTFLNFNLPLQVSTKRINDGAYNSRLLNSGILTSNITEASVKGTWFITDYFDDKGNLHEAISPASVMPQPKRETKTPVGGNEGAIAGTKITSVFSKKTYYVDIQSNIIRDDQGRIVQQNENNKILFDLAWAQNAFGDNTESSEMIDNKVITPNNQILDRTGQKYITGEEAEHIRARINEKNKKVTDKGTKFDEVIHRIYDNQKKVDKTKTDGEYYYILEDDGQYHKYARVHSRLGSNWILSEDKAREIKAVEDKLVNITNAPNFTIDSYNEYLSSLENKYNLNLSKYRDKTDNHSTRAILNIVRDAIIGTKSQRALEAGSAIDNVIRQYFTIEDISKIVRPDNITEGAYNELITTLNRIKSNMESKGERFLADNIVLFKKYSDGTRIAGEVDILSVTEDGNFRIYDIKTGKYSFGDFIDRTGNKVNYFTNKASYQVMSTKDYYTLQLSAYKNLFESQYGVPITKLAIMPFVLSYDNNDNVTAIKNEKGIPITYNPDVNVPLIDNVKVTEPVETPVSLAQDLLPIFDSFLDRQNPIEDLASEYSMDTGDDESVGYFEIDGKLHKGYMTRLTVVDGVLIYITKVPNITKGFGKDTSHVASNSYYVVFPNGKTILMINNNPVKGGLSQAQVEQSVSERIRNNPQRVQKEAAEETILTKYLANINEGLSINTAHINTDNIDVLQEEKSVMESDDEFEDELILRKEDNTLDTPIWNQEKELNWLSKVLPQLSESDRVKIVKGLIRVGNQGTLAWGQFSNGIITLSDIAAEGTVYHEAFHAVFRLLLDQNERLSLLNEYKVKHPNMDDLSLEEELAEDFREFVMQGGKDTRSLGRKIIDFFKSLFIKTKYWKDFRPSSIYYFRAINGGKYTNKEIKVSSLSETRARQEEYTQEMKNILANAPRDSEGRLLAPNGKLSNLNERQYAQVRTKAFKEWFGDWENESRNSTAVNRVFENTGLGLGKNNPNRFETKEDSIYRITGRSQIDDIIESGYVRPPKGKLRGGKQGEAHWARGDNKLFYTDTERYILETKKDINDKVGALSIDDLTAIWKFDGTKWVNIISDIKASVNSTTNSVSKVLDENGEPLVVYHTRDAFKGEDFNIFDTTIEGRESAIYTTNNKEMSSSYWKFGNNRKALSDLYKLSIIGDIDKIDIDPFTGKPLEDSVNRHYTLLIKVLNELGVEIDDTKNTYTQKEIKTLYNNLVEQAKLEDLKILFVNIKNPLIVEGNGTYWNEIAFGNEKLTTRKIEDKFKNSKYDGIIFKNIKDWGDYNIGNISANDVYAVYKPNQIKSATDNIGTFSTTNDDIRYRIVPNSSFEVLRAEEKEMLLKKGWTVEKFNSISQEERDHIIKCIAF